MTTHPGVARPRWRHWPLWGLALVSLLTPAASVPTIRIGLGDSQPPYLIADTHSGIEYEIIDGALRLAGYRMEAHFVPRARMAALYTAGQLDAVATVTERSGLPGYYSNSDIAYVNYAITLSSRHLKIDSIADLGHYAIASFQQAKLELGADFRAMADANPNYREVSPQVLRNNLLYAGHADVAISDVNIFRYFNTHHDVDPHLDTTQPITLHPLFAPHAYKVVFTDATVRDRFNDALTRFEASPAYADIQRRYDWTPPDTAHPPESGQKADRITR